MSTTRLRARWLCAYRVIVIAGAGEPGAPVVLRTDGATVAVHPRPP